MKPVVLLLWTARVWGIASTLLLAAFALGGGEHLRMTASEAVPFLFFPVGVIVGFAIAWRRELAGGLVTVGSLVLFYLSIFVVSGQWRLGPYFLLFAAPGFIHIVAALMTPRGAPGSGTGHSVESSGNPGGVAA